MSKKSTRISQQQDPYHKRIKAFRVRGYIQATHSEEERSDVKSTSPQEQSLTIQTSQYPRELIKPLRSPKTAVRPCLHQGLLIVLWLNSLVRALKKKNPILLPTWNQPHLPPRAYLQERSFQLAQVQAVSVEKHPNIPSVDAKCWVIMFFIPITFPTNVR
ncbi:hypothetical protein BDM02DRAFT_3133045 [Thelephora ganbajun]|uniref:Uncharacterized protein n=1 Tax=Thelephora ganbajun TaxID=370292 RepID=A0ACB6YYH7_THEGA|nr:hypothetical protein BDM02DRAFT_3133045 [Thelephora ganbajun]